MRSKRKGQFLKGFDARRHVFTPEERFKGGMNCWAMTMADLRLSMNLPLPSEKLRQAAKEILKRKVRNIYISTFEGLLRFDEST